MQPVQNQLIYRFPRREDEEIHFTLRVLESGATFIDVRIWSRPNQESPFIPTRKGLWVRLNQVHELKKGVQTLIEVLQNQIHSKP